MVGNASNQRHVCVLKVSRDATANMTSTNAKKKNLAIRSVITPLAVSFVIVERILFYCPIISLVVKKVCTYI